MGDKFKTAKGRLTAYAFACGYIETAEANGIQVTLWQEHGVYHVRAHDFKSHMRLAWDSFHTLGEGRKAYARMIRQYGVKP